MNGRRLLVVNADDAGLHTSTDEAILRCAEDGILSSVSVATTGPTCGSFVPRAIDAGLGIGLHFNITEGEPLLTDLESLCGASVAGLRPKEAILDPCIWGAIDPDVIAREARAQWSRLLDLGARPDHLDSHNHVHVLPTVREGLRLALGDEEGLFVRTPCEPECPPRLLPQPLEEDCAHLSDDLPEGASWRQVDRFLGLIFSHRPDASGVSHLVPAATGVTEWMTHPGSRPGSAFTSSSLRSQEVEFLCRPETRELVRAAGYDIVAFGSIP